MIHVRAASLSVPAAEMKTRRRSDTHPAPGVGDGEEARWVVNPFTVMVSLENNQSNCEISNPSAFFSSFFAVECERIFNKAHNIESRCAIGPEDTVCRCLRASFSPETLHGGAVNGLRLGQCGGGCPAPYGNMSGEGDDT